MIQSFLVWLQDTERHRPLTPITIREYERQLIAFVRWFTEDLGIVWTPPLSSAHRMSMYLQYMQLTLRRAPATQMKAIAALRVFGTWLVETGQLSTNPARLLRAHNQQPFASKALSPRIVRRIIDAAHHTGNLRDAVVIELLVGSGMRTSEIANLQIEDLIHSERTMWILIHGKGNKLRRIPLPKKVGQLVNTYLAERALKTNTTVITGTLLVGQRGGITRTTINDIVAKVINRANLTPAERTIATPHAFRHTLATMLVRDRDLVMAADILGHTNINTTRRYAKASSKELEIAIEETFIAAQQ